MASKEALRIYRGMLKMTRSMQSKDKENIIQQIRQGFRNSLNVTDPSELQKTIEKANSTLGYLKMVTPKSCSNQVGTFRKVYIKSSCDDIVGGKKAVTNWHGGNLDPDSRARHFKQLERAGFKNNAHAKGIF